MKFSKSLDIPLCQIWIKPPPQIRKYNHINIWNKWSQ